jgi:hypothetical protein
MAPFTAYQKASYSCLEPVSIPSAQIRGFHDLLREKPSSLLMLGWSSISIASLMIRSGVVHLGTMAQVYAVLNHGRLLRMVEMDVLLMF